MPKNLAEVIDGSEAAAMADMNPELANAFMGIIHRILKFCKAKGVNPKDVAITGPHFIDGRIGFKVKYGKLDPERGL